MAELWSPREIAAYIGVNPKTVYNRVLCRAGFPVAVRPTGGRRLWVRIEVEEWVKRQRETLPQQAA